MEFSEDSIDRTLVFKGKRSKRPRQFMAVAMFTSTSSTAGDGGVDGGSDDGRGGGETYSSSIQYSPTTSTTQISTSSTEEDEDMANCLILLAQSGQYCQKLQVERSERKMVKISSRKFTEMATTTNGKAGFYVYECKTCNRTFPSFQALGGHRTSHKKIKTVTEEKKSTADSNSQSQGAHHHHQQQQQKDEEKFNRIITPSMSLMNSKPKIHECSICGAEFSSGQALGGHMRRHRPPTITTTNTKITVEETSNASNSSHHDDDNENSKDQKKPKIFLSLDLNLPASPEDDHQRDSNFEFSANKQNLVFSAAPLVDCHY